MIRIIILEDSRHTRDQLARRLRSYPTRAEVIACSRVAEAIREARLVSFDAAILDATASPEEVPREIRQAHAVVAKGPGWIAKIEELLRQ